jgi:hypothetical protein
LKIAWTKSTGDAWSARVEPFLLKVEPKGDGRFTWHVFKGEATGAAATGVAASAGAAKTVAEQFVKRSGLV